MTEPRSRWRWVEVVGGTLAGVLIGFALLAWLLLRSGEAPSPASRVMTPAQPESAKVSAKRPKGRHEPQKGGPLIGAFSTRVERRLKAGKLKTTALVGPLSVKVQKVVWVEPDGRRLAEVPSARAQLDLTSARAGDIVISNAVLEKPRVRLRESGGRWNYERVLAGPPTRKKPSTSRRPAPKRTVRVQGLTIKDGTLDVNAKTSFALNDVDARFDRILVSGPSTPAPEFEVATASAMLVRAPTIEPVRVVAADAKVEIRKDVVAFDITTARYDGITADMVDGTYSGKRPGLGIEATGKVHDLQLADLEPFLPKTIPVEGTVSFGFAVAPTAAGGTRLQLTDLDLASGESHVTGAVALRFEPGAFVLQESNLKLNPLEVSLLEPFTGPLPYSGTVRGTVTGPADALRFDLVASLRTTGGVTFPTRLSGVVDIGETGGLRRLTADFENIPLVALQPFLPQIQLTGTVSGTISLAGAPGAAPIEVDLRLNLAAGIVTLDGLVDLTGAVPRYDLTGRLVGVEPALILERPIPPVLVTADFSLTGSGVALETAVARLELTGRFTGWKSNPGDAILVRAGVDAGVVTVDALRLGLSTLKLEAEGEWRAIQPVSGSIRYAIAIESLKPWAEYVPMLADTAMGAPSVAGSFAAEGTVTGNLDAPRFAGSIEGKDLHARGWTFNSIEATYDVALGTAVPVIIVSARASGIQSSAEGAFTTAKLDLRLSQPTFTFELLANQRRGGVVQVSADGTIPAGGPRELVLRHAVVDVSAGKWTLVQPATFNWGDTNGLVVHEFEMRNTTSLGRVLVDGRVLPLDAVDVRIQVAALPIGEIQEMFGVQARVTGLFSTNAHIQGPGAAPTVAAEFQLENGKIADMPVEMLKGRLDYGNRSLLVNATAALDTAGAFVVDVQLPVAVSLTSGSAGVRIIDNGALRGSITAESVSLSPLGELSLSVRNLSGRLDGTVTLGGTPSAPDLGGKLRLLSGEARITALNQTYTNITADIGFEGRRAVIAPLQMQGDGGVATITGVITFEQLTHPVADLFAQFDKFVAVGVSNYKGAAVGGSVDVKGPYDALEVTGALSVDNGYVPIPEFGSRAANLDEISAAGLPGIAAPSKNALVEGLVIKDLTVKIGSNVWFTSEAARAQLSGDLTINKDRDTFSLRGTLSGQRGVYTLQAGPIVRRFDITSAEIRFLGLPEPDPAIDVTATKTILDANGRPVDIDVRVTGSVRAPVLSLGTEGGAAIPESELLSLMFFGRPSAELGGAGLPGGSLLEYTFLGGLAELATVELEQALIENVGLAFDIFEVRFGPGGIGGFGSPIFVFGWELGPHLFLTTESAIGAFAGSSDVVANTWAIRLEWAFDRNSQLRFSLEPVIPSTSFRGRSFALPSVRPRQQLSADLRRRWNY